MATPIARGARRCPDTRDSFAWWLRSREIAQDALDHLSVLRAHLTRGDLSDQTIADAVTMRLAAAIEAIAQGSDGLQKRLFDSEWHVVWATRNRIAHSYKDHGIIGATVAEDLPEIERALAAEVARSA